VRSYLYLIPRLAFPRHASTSRALPWIRVALIFSALILSAENILAQEPSPASSDVLQGTVLNSSTHEPIPRALVYSPDNRFATMTDSQGRFQFVFAAAEPKATALPVPNAQFAVQTNRPYMLTARKPGFLIDPKNEAQGVLVPPASSEITIVLVPEAVVVGHVTLPSAEAPDRIALELYQRQVQDGRAHWRPRATTISSFSGEFRFAGLPAGTYKLFTRELPEAETFAPGQQQYAYPPVYYPNAQDFASAAELQLTPGKVLQADLTLTRQPYFPIKLPVLNTAPNVSLNVAVSLQGQRGPGYALEYNPQQQTIQGSLPNGSFTIEAFGFGTVPLSGSNTITVRGSSVEGPSLVVVPGRSIQVNVKEEFTSSSQRPNTSVTAIFDRTPFNGKRRFTRTGLRSYLNLSLEPVDDFNQNTGSSLRNPASAEDNSLAIEGVQPGRYWVRLNPGRGYASSVTSGGIDLLHAPLVVGSAGAVAPIEVTMRDDMAQLDGTLEFSDSNSSGLHTAFSSDVFRLYCIPADDSPGRFTQLTASGDGAFPPFPLSPGVYRLLAFKGTAPEIEYRNPEAMRLYDGKGVVVRLVAGQSEHVRVPVISSE
jgi:hypothetical protein